MAQAAEYDAIVLDLMLPGLDGVERLSALARERRVDPVLMLTARDAIEDRVAGLDAGADDYLPKPFSFAELLARLRALVRRGAAERPAVLEVGDLRLDPATRQVWRGETEIKLSAKEFALLETFMRRPGDVLSRLQLLEHAWDYAYENRSNVVDVYVRYLREKIDRPFARDSIETVRGVGYRLRREWARSRGEPASDSAATDARVRPRDGRRAGSGRCVPLRAPRRDASTSGSHDKLDATAALRLASDRTLQSATSTRRSIAGEDGVAQVIERRRLDRRSERSTVERRASSSSQARAGAQRRRGSRVTSERGAAFAAACDARSAIVSSSWASSLEDRDEALERLLAQLLRRRSRSRLLASRSSGTSSPAPRCGRSRRCGVEAEAISASEPDRRLPLPAAHDEIHRLGETLNEMLERLGTALERERAFVADASHELRTPLALLKAELELAMRKPRTAEELERALRSAGGGDRSARSARRGSARSSRAPIRGGSDSAAVARAAWRASRARRRPLRARARASAGRRIERVSADDELELDADPVRLEQALGQHRRQRTPVRRAGRFGSSREARRRCAWSSTSRTKATDPAGVRAARLRALHPRGRRARTRRDGARARASWMRSPARTAVRRRPRIVDGRGADVWMSFPTARL